ncbi:hypothetical protein H8356DRAFT_1737454 [Neocallimastix lanati (nom. inval.)]|uniref:Uncharacterized protein n=1 Tax=Neocallimastix californiae TaxID=1754190 RepID=A0A1Y2EGP7_9FUNG|nr:hypothetical protein H8356DRAFT_1737454 [Neocallimastix sp. JGI-2020a]ORY70750.1 hypothetical protein LY90DRAFT_638725 [Neocallimastix californiae]|eukprot:ORY70750.1 hypothetical protein LY90DRAFT_638725 [Neocallimastix californiae]
MKFSTHLLTLVAATTAVLSYNIPVKREDDKCESEIKDYKPCVDLILVPFSSENINASCKTLATEQCQKFFTDIEEIAPSCIDNKKYDYLSKGYVKQYAAQNKYMCVMDENNKLCPITDLNINLIFNKNAKPSVSEINNQSDKASEETCYSKKCTDALAEYYKTLSEDEDIIKMMAKSKAYNLNADDFKKDAQDSYKFFTNSDCTKKAGTRAPKVYSENASTSEASNIYVKMSSMAMLTLSVLYLLY